MRTENLEFRPETTNEFIKPAYKYLDESCENGLYRCFLGNTRSMTGELQPTPTEIGSSLLILETVLKHRPETAAKKDTLEACKKQLQNGHFNFFIDKGLLPDDADTTSYGLSSLLEMDQIKKESIEGVLDEIVNNIDDNGIMQVYFNPGKMGRSNRIDHVAIANILHLLNLTGKEQKAAASQDFVYRFLADKSYLNGSRYYHSPDIFLYFLGRLMKFPKMKDVFYGQLNEELKSRIGTTDFPLDLAMRITTARKLGFENTEEIEKLKAMKNSDGSWPSDSIYHYGGKNGYFGSSLISTSFSIEALED